MQEENGPFRSRVVHHHSSQRDVLVYLEQTDIGSPFLLRGPLGVSRRDGRAQHCNGCANPGGRGDYRRLADKMEAMKVDLVRTGVHDQSPWFERHPCRGRDVSLSWGVVLDQ
jgi:hypothetical protein